MKESKKLLTFASRFNDRSSAPKLEQGNTLTKILRLLIEEANKMNQLLNVVALDFLLRIYLRVTRSGKFFEMMIGIASTNNKDQ